MSQDTDLKTAIETRLFAIAGMPDADHRALENAAAADPDTGYEPTPGEPWVRVTHRFGIEQLMTLPAVGGRLWKYGFTQVDAFFPTLEGCAALDTLMDAIRASFAPELTLSVSGLVLRIRSSQRWGGERDGNWWWDHADIYWQFRAVNPLI